MINEAIDRILLLQILVARLGERELIFLNACPGPK
jgi:hypothetical protein